MCTLTINWLHYLVSLNYIPSVLILYIGYTSLPSNPLFVGLPALPTIRYVIHQRCFFSCLIMMGIIIIFSYSTVCEDSLSIGFRATFSVTDL